MKKDRVTLKTYFETGDYPTEAQFIDLIDSFLNIEEDEAITSIVDNGDGTYTFNLLSGGSVIIAGGGSGKLIALDEGNGIGYTIDGQDRSLRANIGENSIDLGLIDPFAPVGTDYGASATHSVNLGHSNKISGGGYSGTIGSTNIISSASFSNYIMGVFNKILSGYGNQCIGLYNEAATNANGFAVLLGMNNRAAGNFPAGTLGMALDVRARNQVAVGVANTLWGGGGNAANRPIFVVGIGTHTTPSGPFAAILRKDGFVVNHDGTAFLPESTIAKIDAADGKHLATKEWVLANAGGGGGSGAFEAIDEGNGSGIVVTGRNANNYGNVGAEALDFSFSSSSSTTYGATGNRSISLGRFNTSSGVLSVTMGNTNNATGQGSVAIGSSNTSENTNSIAIGDQNVASGRAGAAIGLFMHSRSYGEVSVGLHGTDYVANNPTSHGNQDRVFNVGNGTAAFLATRKDAFTILKSGNTAIGINNFEANDTGEKLQVEGLLKSNVTTAQIDAGSVKTVPTKEWVLANAGGGPSNNIFTSDGILPSATTRLVGIPVDSSLQIVSSGPNWGSAVSIDLNNISINSASVDMSTAIRNNGVTFSDTGSARLFARDGIQIRIGETGSTLNSPTVGQVLTAVNTDGSAEWADAPTSSKPYNSYVALLSQTGANPISAIVLENDLGGSISWVKSGTGVYIGTLTGAFPINKVAIFTGGDMVFPDATIRSKRINDNQIRLTVNVGSTAFDGVLSSTSIEVKVYS